VHRLSLAVLLLLLAVVPVAGAQDDPTTAIAHDGSLDDTPREIHSGYYAGDPAGTVDPLAVRPANTYETFTITVPEGTRRSRLEASIGWKDDRIDLDVSIYRADPAGRPAAPVLARSAVKRSASERAVYAPSEMTVEPGRYVVVVDNVCSSDRDLRPAGAQFCRVGADIPDEDDFEGTVALGNQAPSVTLTGPASVRAKETATFGAVATDADGTISTYLFDFDGDGTYEIDSDGNPEAQTIFPARGPRSIGVQVLDDAGAAAFATLDVNVTRAAPKPDTRPPLTAFTLNRTTWGGGDPHSLQVTYKLREKARVELKLRRGSRVVRLIDRGVRKANRSYRIRLRPAHLRRGRYTLRIFVQAASGKRQVAELSARRR